MLFMVLVSQSIDSELAKVAWTGGERVAQRHQAGWRSPLELGDCRRRFNIDPLCRLNFDSGVDADRALWSDMDKCSGGFLLFEDPANKDLDILIHVSS